MDRPNRQRWYRAGLSLLLLALMTIVFWQTSLSFGDFRPDDLQQTLVLWGISTLVFLGMVALGFMLFRNFVKLYSERSKIKTRLVLGALGLTILPVVFLFFFAFSVLNNTLNRWFSQPIEQVQRDSLTISEQLKDAGRENADTLAAWIASLPEVAQALRDHQSSPGVEARLREFARQHPLAYIAVGPAGAESPLVEQSSAQRFAGAWARLPQLRPRSGEQALSLFPKDSYEIAFASRAAGGGGRVLVGWQLPPDLAARQKAIDAQYRSYQEQARYRRYMRYTYVGMLLLITLFILFVATWIALLLSKQIILPIERLMQATDQVSSGHLDYRVKTGALDELGRLVSAFNHMTEQLEHSREELDARRRFTEAILEGIPTGVISLSAGGEILRVNPALGRIFAPEKAAPARWLDDLLSPEDAAQVKRLIRRAQKTGLATGSLDLTSGGQVTHLAVTVSALETDGPFAASRGPHGCVIVLEDTSEVLRAQKSAAWQEVAQRVAHEIKNPLTPIALSAERISRLVERYRPDQDVRARLDLDRLLNDCTATIIREIETLKTLVDEFSQFARFPAARPQPGELNEAVEMALEACNGRLDAVRLDKRLAPDLPLVSIDLEQFKRAVVNLVENAIEAMGSSATAGGGQVLHISTALGAGGDTVELVVADSGHGIAPEDREKLFLPYFSTRKRGTGLGLAIVSRIVTEHKGAIRVEDNQPHGARFIVEVPIAAVGELVG